MRALRWITLFLLVATWATAGTVYDPILGRMKQSELPSGGTEGQVIKKAAGTGVYSLTI